MHKNFIDTNILLRFLLEEKTNDGIKAKKIFEDAVNGKCSLATNSIVIFEVAWVLKSFYEKEKTQIIETIEKLLSLPFFEIENKNILYECIDLFSESNVELIDCYNIVYSQFCKSDNFLTFDKKVEKVLERLKTD